MSTPTTPAPASTPAAAPASSTTSSEASNSQATPTTPAAPAPSSEPAAAPAAPAEPTKVDPPAAAAAAKTDPEVLEEYDLELAEDSPISDEELAEIAEQAGRLGLSKEDAQKFVEAREKAYKNGFSKAEAARQEKIQASLKEISEAPEFSPENKVQSFESINLVLETFGDKEFVELMKTPEYGNNLVIARFLKRLGDTMKPDKIEGKGVVTPPAGAEQSVAQKLYPDFFK